MQDEHALVAMWMKEDTKEKPQLGVLRVHLGRHFSQPAEDLLLTLSQTQFDDAATQVLPEFRLADVLALLGDQLPEGRRHSALLAWRKLLQNPPPNGRGTVILKEEFDLKGHGWCLSGASVGESASLWIRVSRR
jgi:hypothetical protein